MLEEHDNRGFWRDGCSCDLSLHLWRMNDVDVFILFWLCDCWGAAVQLRSSTQSAATFECETLSACREWRQHEKQHLFISETCTESSYSDSEAQRRVAHTCQALCYQHCLTQARLSAWQSNPIMLQWISCWCAVMHTSNSIDSIIAGLFLSRAIIQDNSQSSLFICNSSPEYVPWTMVGDYSN